MLIQKRLPSAVSDDIITWIADTSIPRMNKDVLLGLADESDIGEIELDIGGSVFNFRKAELAPPSGAMAANYSR
jgi:hypothetical protein